MLTCKPPRHNRSFTSTHIPLDILFMSLRIFTPLKITRMSGVEWRRSRLRAKPNQLASATLCVKTLEMILKGSPKELPVVNQLEYHPYIQRENDGVPYIPWMQEQGIQVEAFKVLTPLARCPEGPLVGPLERMAKAHNVSDSAVMLRWFLQQNIVGITTTRKQQRLQEYAEALTFELTKDEMDEIFTEGKKLFKRFYFPERYDPDDRS